MTRYAVGVSAGRCWIRKSWSSFVEKASGSKLPRRSSEIVFALAGRVGDDDPSSVRRRERHRRVPALGQRLHHRDGAAALGDDARLELAGDGRGRAIRPVDPSCASSRVDPSDAAAVSTHPPPRLDTAPVPGTGPIPPGPGPGAGHRACRAGASPRPGSSRFASAVPGAMEPVHAAVSSASTVMVTSSLTRIAQPSRSEVRTPLPRPSPELLPERPEGSTEPLPVRRGLARCRCGISQAARAGSDGTETREDAMRARRWIVVGFVLGACLALPLEAAADGGAFIEFRGGTGSGGGGTHFLPGDVATGTGYVYVPEHWQDLLDRGPFYVVCRSTKAPSTRGAHSAEARSVSARRRSSTIPARSFLIHMSFTVPDVPGGLLHRADLQRPVHDLGVPRAAHRVHVDRADDARGPAPEPAAEALGRELEPGAPGPQGQQGERGVDRRARAEQPLQHRAHRRGRPSRGRARGRERVHSGSRHVAGGRRPPARRGVGSARDRSSPCSSRSCRSRSA